MYLEIHPELTQKLIILCVKHTQEFGFVKGSDFHNTVMDYFHGKRFADSYDTEKFLAEFISSEFLQIAHHCPTHNQLVLGGLGYSKAGYNRTIKGSFENIAGLRTHFAYIANLK